MNRLIRVCAEKPNNLETLAIVRGILVLYFNKEKQFAYGVALKYQGGGTWGDYHIIGQKSKDLKNWQFNAGNFQPFDGFYDEMEQTASTFNNFNQDDAKKYIEQEGDDSMYACYYQFNKDIFDDKIRENCTKKEFKVLGYNKDDKWDIDEDGDYYNSKLCTLSDIEGYKKSDGYLWFSENHCDKDLLSEIESNDLVIQISKKIPGNIDFF